MTVRPDRRILACLLALTLVVGACAAPDPAPPAAATWDDARWDDAHWR